ncbi:hypothetical protein D3C81_1748680 [compost metagenome]
MHPDAAGTDVFTDGGFIIIPVDRVRCALRAVHFQTEPAVSQRVGRIASGDMLLIIRPVFDFDDNFEAAFRREALGFACGNRKGSDQLAAAEIAQRICFFVHNNQIRG